MCKTFCNFASRLTDKDRIMKKIIFALATLLFMGSAATKAQVTNVTVSLDVVMNAFLLRNTRAPW